MWLPINRILEILQTTIVLQKAFIWLHCAAESLYMVAFFTETT